MKLTPRVELVVVDPMILSSYPVGSSRDKLKPLCKMNAGTMPADAALALALLNDGVMAAGGDFTVTDGRREIGEQQVARHKYEYWLAAGKPKGSAFDSHTMKSAFVAEPGYSFHNAGRSIDNDTGRNKFPGVPADKQLDKMWEIARPLGWRPAIREAKEGSNESWHYDYMGPWANYYYRCGDYKMVAMCACLDIGVGIYGRDDMRMLQAQLQRAGYDCGAVDGYSGGKTERALVAAGFSANERDYTKLFSLKTA